ncbi:MAG TPA: IPT/TIG domain-containing protein, partial [Acidimicrobiia bacterium]|nr:IPT/TIG domain-containing protein [Acidimicrobiia bacterium]
NRLLLNPMLLGLVGLLALAGCSDPPLIDGDAHIPTPDAGPAPDSGPEFDDGGGIGMTDLSLARVVPDHGPFIGGNEVILRGNGFTADGTATFGGREVQGADHRLIDARRLSAVVPAGEVGIVDVTYTVDGETVTLPDGYRYDPIYVEPDSGAVAGGTFVSIIGSGTDFADGDVVSFGRAPCTDVTVVSPTRITCRTPPSAAGSVDVTVIDGDDAAEISAEDAFTYFDSSDPFSGGLGGGPLEGTINVTVIDAMTGAPVPDAYSIVGEDLTTPHQGLTDSLGQITFSGEDIVPPATVHVSKFCYERTSFVAFDARDVTIFLVPWMDPMCGMGSPPPGGGRGRNGAVIEGHLQWPTDMAMMEWYNVPEPRSGWVRVAYVYTTQARLGFENPDPAAGGGTQRVLESPLTAEGFPYSIFARPAGLAVYALAGLENTTTGRFIPYIMGVARNVLAGPGETVSGVNILMNIPLDHYLDVALTELPMEARSGPDRYRLQANIDLGGEGIIVRNVNGDELDVLRRRDASRTFRFVAQPSLENALADGRYRVEAGWFTGDFDSPPYTVAVENGVTAVDTTLTIGAFLGIPQATAPAYGERLPADRILRWSADGPDPSLHIVLIQGADGNPAWRQFLPGDVREAPIPNLSSIEGIDDMPPGFMSWAVFAITIPGLDFDTFSYEYLSDRFWTRWALDVYLAQR